MQKPTLWTKNFTTLTLASICGAIGGIAGNFALSFLVFDETGSTLASALIIAMQLVPSFIIPIFVAPIMDRLPRKPFLVWSDAVIGVLIFAAGLFLMFCDFSYIGYLFFSLFLSTIGAIDSLAYTSIYPKVIPEGMEQKGYAVSSTLYPVMNVIMMPVAAILLDAIGVAWILVIQGFLCIFAALIENTIKLSEESRLESQKFSISLWWQDIKDAVAYLKGEKGLLGIYGYSSVTNGVANGYYPLLVAFFRVTPGFSAAMYSLFSVAEFLGRSIGGVVQYRLKLAKEKKFGFCFFIYVFYEAMDAILLWIPYPLMLINRAMAGFLGVNSGTIRQAAVQTYIPDEYRSRVNSFEGMLSTAVAAFFSITMGALGEVLDWRLCMTLGALIAHVACWVFVWGNRRHIKKIYEYEPSNEA